MRDSVSGKELWKRILYELLRSIAEYGKIVNATCIGVKEIRIVTGHESVVELWTFLDLIYHKYDQHKCLVSKGFLNHFSFKMKQGTARKFTTASI